MAFDIDLGGAMQEPNQAAPPAPTAPTPAPSPAAAPPPVPVQAPPAPQPTAPAPEPQPPALVHPAHRSMFGAIASALIGGTLGTVARGTKGIAGPQPAHYVTDESGRVVRDPNQPADTTASRLQRLAENALLGLAYGAQAGPQKSAAASWAAGIGAGAAGITQHNQQQDLLRRQQTTDEYERSQKLLTEKAVRAMHNASTYALYMKNAQEQNDHDPERQKNADIVTAARDYIERNPGTTLSVSVVSPEEAMAMRESDAHAVATHTFLPIGLKPAVDDNGHPLYEADGVTPRMVGQIAVISGGSDAKLPITKGFYEDLQEYGKLAGIVGTDRFSEGQEIPIMSFLNIDKRLNDAKRREVDEWKNAKELTRADGTKVLVNPFSGKFREPPPVAAGAGGGPVTKLQQLQDELNKGVTGERAAEIAAGLQNLIDDPVNAAIRPILLKLQLQASTQAEASTKFATKKAGAVAGAEAEAKQRYEVNKPVYAYNTQTKQLEQTTKGNVAANPTLYTNPIDVKEADVRKDTDLARQLGDAQLNLSRYRVAAQKLDSLSLGDKRAVAALIGDDRFKAELMGAQIPTDWLNKLLTAENWNMLPTAAQDAVIGYIGSRGAVIAYQKAVSGSGRSNKEQLELELQNIPNPLLPKDVRERQFDRFQQNIDQTGAGLPKMVGVDRPKEIRQRIEAETAQGQIPPGATHIGKDAKGNIVGYVLNGQWVSVGGKQ